MEYNIVIYLKRIGLLLRERNLNHRNIVVSLADYLKNLSPSDCYDIAMNLVRSYNSNHIGLF